MLAQARTDSSQALVALRRLLGQVDTVRARVDALLALCQRPVWLAMWPGQNEARTLTGDSRQIEMPIFTGIDTLISAANHLGWRGADGDVAMRETTMRDALRHALARGAQCVVVDLGTSHELLIALQEIESLVEVTGRRSTPGPYAVGPQEQQNLTQAVMRSSRPPPSSRGDLFPENAVSGPRNLTSPRSSTPHTRSSQPTPFVDGHAIPALKVPSGLQPVQGYEHDAHTRITLPGFDPELDETTRFEIERGKRPRVDTPHSLLITAPPPNAFATSHNPPPLALNEEILDALADSLRPFPEVEWACILNEDAPETSIGLRLANRFYDRLDEIFLALDRVAAAHQGSLVTLLLAEPDAVQQARQSGVVFYPGRRRSLIPR